MYVCVCVCMRACMHACMYVYMYVGGHTLQETIAAPRVLCEAVK